MNIRKLSQKVAAELLGVHARTLRDWPDPPRNPDGTYPGPELVAWLIERRTPDEPDTEDQRQRLAAAQAEKVEMENAVRRGELAEVAVVGRTVTDLIANARTRLLRLPLDCAAEVPPDQRPAALAAARKAVHEALTALAKYPGA